MAAWSRGAFDLPNSDRRSRADSGAREGAESGSPLFGEPERQERLCHVVEDELQIARIRRLEEAAIISRRAVLKRGVARTVAAQADRVDDDVLAGIGHILADVVQTRVEIAYGSGGAGSRSDLALVQEAEPGIAVGIRPFLGAVGHEHDDLGPALRNRIAIGHGMAGDGGITAVRRGKGVLGEMTRQPQAMPIWTAVPPASRGHMLLIVLSTAFLPVVVVTSVSGRTGTGQPSLGPLKVSQSVVTCPWISPPGLAFVCATIVPGVQLLMPVAPAGHQKGYHFIDATGSDVSGSAVAEFTAPPDTTFSSELVGSTTQPIQFAVVAECVVS